MSHDRMTRADLPWVASLGAVGFLIGFFWAEGWTSVVIYTLAGMGIGLRIAQFRRYRKSDSPPRRSARRKPSVPAPLDVETVEDLSPTPQAAQQEATPMPNESTADRPGLRLMKDRRSKLFTCGVIFTLLVVWLKPFDALAEHHVQSGLKRALVSFAAARGLNAILSEVQSVQINVGVGVGVSANPGALLEPIDDLVEQFSTLMLAASVSFMAQSLILGIFTAWPVSLALTSALLFWLYLRHRGKQPPSWLPGITLAVLCMRLAVPMMAIGSEMTYQLLLAPQYEASQAAVTSKETADDSGILNKAKAMLPQAAGVVAMVTNLKSRMEALVEHMVSLAAVFLIQVMALPLLFLWMLLRCYRVAVLRFSKLPTGETPAS